MDEKGIVWEKRVGNLILRNIEGQTFNVTVTRPDGSKEDKGEATVHYITLTNVDNSFSVAWREDTLVYQLLEKCHEQPDENTDLITEVVALTTFCVGSSADVCRPFKKKDGGDVVDGLRLSVQRAVSDYFKRVGEYAAEDGDEPEEKIIEDMKAYTEAQSALDGMKADEAEGNDQR